MYMTRLAISRIFMEEELLLVVVLDFTVIKSVSLYGSPAK